MKDRISPRSDALEKLENYIYTNHLSAGFRIPSEREFCEMWGIHRTTLRFALEILISNGYLYRKKGIGMYIAEPKWTRNLQGVDALASAIRQQGIPFTTKILSSRTIECNKQISRKLQVPLGRKIYESIRLRNINDQPCIIETTYISGELAPDFNTYDLEKVSMYSVFKNVYHFHIVSGEEMISVTYTTPEEARLFNIKPGTPVFSTTGITKLSDGVPLEYYKALFRADRFKFVSKITRDQA
jgi:GntR family transcriptional regulator